MTSSGDAAEQVVQISLEGIDYSLRIAGGAAKQIAAFLLAAMQSDGKDKQTKIHLEGKETLKKFLKSGKETTVFSIKDKDLKAFKDEAKKYGLAYCVLKDMDGNAKTVEIMAKEEDAPKINRIVERLEFAEVDRTSVKSEKTPRAVLKAERQTAKVDRRLANRKANKAYRSSMSSARKDARKSRRERARTAYVQYRQDIGRPVKVKEPKERSETMLLFAALVKSITGKIPLLRNIGKDDKDSDKDDYYEFPEPEIPTQAEIKHSDGQSKDGQNKAVQKDSRSIDPSARTEKAPPSEVISRSESKPTRVTEGYSTKPPSVKTFLTDPKVRNVQRKESEKIRQSRTGQKPTKQKQKQPQKKARNKTKKSRERAS